MNKLFTLRSLTIFSFVIFFLPFMNTCSSYSLQEVPIEDAVEITENEKVELAESTTNEKNDFLDEGEKEIYTFNFYILSLASLDDFKLENLTDSFFYAFLGFTIILISSILILLFSFKNKFRNVYRFSIFNLIILGISTLILCLTEIVENLNQIKIGYYLFVLNSLAIIYFSKKIENEKRTSDL